jgi:predicted nucleic acid-binding protein
MSDKFLVDTNILMYAHDTSASGKHERAKALLEELWRDRTGIYVAYFRTSRPTRKRR